MILDRVLETIDRFQMVCPGDRVLVAVSGGPDSVALLRILVELHETLPLALSVAHLDHGLRGSESADDRAFVEEIARSFDLPYASRKEDVAAIAGREKRSLEEAGRIARRRFLREEALRVGARRVALGHHRDDQAESVLMRLIGGAGRGGLSGIKPVSEGLFVRPLLECSRAEILAYLAACGATFRTDPSNADLRFPRNRLRARVLPMLEAEFNPRVAEAIARTAETLREEDVYLERQARGALRKLELAPSRPGGSSELRADLDSVTLDAEGLARLAPPIGRRVVRLALRRSGLHARDLAKGRIEEVLELAARKGSNASLSLGAGLTARIEYGRLSLQRGPGGGVLEADATAGIDQGRAASLAERRAASIAPNMEDMAEGVAADAGGRVPATSEREAGAGVGPGAGAAARIAPGAGPAAGAARGALPTAAERVARGLRSAGGAAHATTSRSDLFEAELSIPGEVVFEDLGLSIRASLAPIESVGSDYKQAGANQAYLDADKLRAPLCVRRPKAGDRLHPLGGPGSRKLSDLWTDLKLTRDERRRLLVVESSGEIVWAAGLRLAHPFRVTETTRRVAQLRIDGIGVHTRRGGSSKNAVAGGEPDTPSGSQALHRVLYSADEIAAAVDRLALEIDSWADGGELLVLGILNGSFIFAADLVRRLAGPVRIGFIDREGTPVSRSLPLEGARILLVEDILDTGESLARVLESASGWKAAEIRTCVLFDKQLENRKVPIDPDFVGLTVPDLWVVGYGLDNEGRERNLPFLTYIDR